MGLDISGEVSEKDYHYGYSGIHQVRWLGLLCMGMPEKLESGQDSFLVMSHPYFDNPMHPEEQIPSPGGFQELFWWIMMAGYYLPNLMFHSDAEGTYTKRGKVFAKHGLESGNSVGLLKELEFIKRDTKEDIKKLLAWEIFNSLYELVKDEVENGKGKIYFH